MNCIDRPLLFKYEAKFTNQTAYIALRANDDIEAYVNENYTDGMSSNVFNGAELRWRIDERLTQNEIDRLKGGLMPWIDELAKLAPIDFKNGNWTRGLNAETLELCRDIERICETTTSYWFDHCEEDACEYCNE